MLTFFWFFFVSFIIISDSAVSMTVIHKNFLRVLCILLPSVCFSPGRLLWWCRQHLKSQPGKNLLFCLSLIASNLNFASLMALYLSAKSWQMALSTAVWSNRIFTVLCERRHAFECRSKANSTVKCVAWTFLVSQCVVKLCLRHIVVY